VPSLSKLFEGAERDEIDDLHFLDLQREVVEAEVARQHEQIGAGPIAENILKRLYRDKTASAAGE